MLTYDILENNPDEFAVINLIEYNAQIYCRNGSLPGYGSFNYGEVLNITIQTNEEQTFCQQTVIRDCNLDLQLVEFQLEVNIKENTPPFFQEQIPSTFEIAFGGISSYQTPPVVDNELNSQASILLLQSEGYEKYYPSFLTLYVPTQTLKFEPLQWNRGQTYYFSIVLNEVDSVSIYTEYFCKVSVLDGLASRLTGDYTDITMMLGDLVQPTWQAPMNMTLTFSENINMARMSGDWLEMFEIYWYE